MSIEKIIEARREELGLTLDQIGQYVGVAKSTVKKWESGQIKEMRRDKLIKLAEILQLDPVALIGNERKPLEPAPVLPPNIVPIKRIRVPLLGNIAAGEPIRAEQEYDTYVEADADVHCDYALRIDGDSMTPTVQLGDLVFIRQQEDVDDGQIAAVLVNESATLKRVRHIPNGLLLMSDNVNYEPMVFTYPECDTIRILGKAVAFKRML